MKATSGAEDKTTNSGERHNFNGDSACNHPFYDGCGEIQKDKVEDIRRIRSWLETQPTLPTLSDEYIYLFLHSNYYDLVATQKTITSFFALRTSEPDLFLNQSPLNPGIQSAFDLLSLVPLPKTTPEGYKVLIFKLSDPNPEKFVHIHAAKAMILFNDIRSAEDGITPGYIIICDARGYSFSHLTKLNLHVTRVYLQYMQEAKPVRLKGLHVLYSAKIIDKLVSLVKPFMRAELQKMVSREERKISGVYDLVSDQRNLSQAELKIHPGEDLSNFFKYVPQEIMPEDYGGKAESLAVLHERNRKLMETKYPKWVEEEEQLLIEATKLQKQKKSTSTDVERATHSFRSLALD